MFSREITFAAICAGVVLLNRYRPFDPDKGGYVPNIHNVASYPKFFVHFITAYAIFYTVLHLGLREEIAAVIMFLAILGYEWSQGFINRLDILAGILGSLVASLIFRV